MNVEFFNFSKKRNSTKQPTDGSGITYNNVQLKDDTSIFSPVILVAVSSMPVATVAPVNTFTYCHIPKFNRYYFVEDWIYTHGIWEGHLSIDVLASHKTEIGASSAYVVRSASTKDGSIIDTLYPATSNITMTTGQKLMNFQSGFYVIGLISNSSTVSEGAISYYSVSAQQMANIKSYLMSNTFLQDNNLYTNPDISPDLLKALYNPYQYIVSCKFYPFSRPTGTEVNGINFGWWTLPYQATRMPEGGNIVVTASDAYTVPAHPQAAARGSYLNHAPYSELTVYHPLIGTIPLDMARINAGDVINILIQAETITGQGYIIIRSTRNNQQYILYQGMTQIAIDIPLAQMNIDTINVARTAVNTVGNIVSSAMSLNVGGVISAAGNGVLDALQCTAPVLQSGGTPGNRASFAETAKFIMIQRSVAPDDNADRGRPLCQVKTINTLSGYIKCADAHFASPCLAAEREQIENLMDSGFFYE